MTQKRKSNKEYEPCSPPVRNGDFIGWVKMVLMAARKAYTELNRQAKK